MELQQEIRKVSRNVKFKLSHVDEANYMREVVDLRNETKELEESKKAFSKEKQHEIDDVEAKIESICKVVSEGEIEKMVEVDEIKDYPGNSVKYLFEGSVVDERALTYEEQQQDLPMADLRPDLDPSEDSAEAAPEDISDVIREETSRHSKVSALDGPA